MKTIVKLHRKHNILVLIGAALVALVSILRLQGSPSVQFEVLALLVLFYLSWALLYHFLDKSLKLEVMIEYILTALLALVILYGVLL